MVDHAYYPNFNFLAPKGLRNLKPEQKCLQECVKFEPTIILKSCFENIQNCGLNTLSSH